ncbi:MAG TPA: flagellar protein export ATPase FliI [Firmicutes bacterium]|nr:flagellar protein export ATPase FliI [Bacillota bacterium]
MKLALRDELNRANPYTRLGRVAQVTGLVVESMGPKVKLGEICKIEKSDGSKLLAEVVGFRGERVLLMPLGELEGTSAGDAVRAKGRQLTIGVGRGLLGRVVNAFGQPLDGLGPIAVEALYPLTRHSPDPMSRKRVSEAIEVGVRAIDGLLTCGKGQRIGIFSGSGVGKSTLMGMIARNTAAEVNVVALVGERGREVRQFVEKDLGPEGLARSVVVVATSDEPPMVRIKAAFAATAIAEYFRDLGMDVMLMMDSVTRFAMAQREVGLAAGEPPTTRGYTPSVFALLPRLLERSGTAARGSITGFYTVLVDGDDMNEPIADAVRGILDGHIVLSRQLASKGHYPAIDVLSSISRLMVDVVDQRHMELAIRLRSILATYKEAEDLVNIGAYVPGSNPDIDYALKMIKPVTAFLCQKVTEKESLAECRRKLAALFESGED